MEKSQLSQSKGGVRDGGPTFIPTLAKCCIFATVKENPAGPVNRAGSGSILGCFQLGLATEPISLLLLCEWWVSPHPTCGC